MKRDALGNRKCATCRWWHDPTGDGKGLMGACVWAPTAVVVGMVPAPRPAIVNPAVPQPQQMVPVVRGFFPPMGAADGCAQHQPMPGVLN